jgi:hypothetical protein
MNNLFRGLLAGYGAKKLGGGCFSTVLIFILLWVLLGQCNATLPPAPAGGDRTEAVVAPAPPPAAQAAAPSAAPLRQAR